uniref:CMP-N-acetylneuraminate-beta-galactosamide- alpha-2,3-sialyltransferase 1-like isoform X2 n=1 Tax=Myxine glutinosa TaxID=7769 RepID=UPI00358F3D05
MERKVKLFLWLMVIGALSYIFKLTMDLQLGLKTQDSNIMWSIFKLENKESDFIEGCPRDVADSSHSFELFKRLFKVPCEPVRSKRSPWFMKRFNASIQPFVSPLSQGIVREDFDWWQKLQKNDISYEAFLDFLRKWDKVLPNSELLFKEKRSICTSCAVVGNSQNLNGSGFGKAIDCHDYVFRMNRGPVEGFENDVGTFTTHRFMYPESATKVPPGTGLIFIPFKMRDLIWLNNTLMKVSNEEKNINATERKKVIVYNPAFMHYVHNNWGNKKGHYPSTGLFAIISVLHSCDKVDVFGFGQNSHGAWPHYWDKRYKEKKGQVYVHNAGNEREMLERLKDNGIIRMFGKT